MARTLVVNYHYDEYDVLITRGTPFGNRNPITLQRTRRQAIEMHFEDMNRQLTSDTTFHDKIMALEGKRLGCVCRPMDCHGDNYAKYIDTFRAVEASSPQADRATLIRTVLTTMRQARPK